MAQNNRTVVITGGKISLALSFRSTRLFFSQRNNIFDLITDEGICPIQAMLIELVVVCLVVDSR